VNACRFCSNTERMRRYAGRPVSRGELAEVLERKRAEGYGHVTFSGGEPTLYPRFWELLRSAKDLGYRTQVISNGAALALPAFAAKTLPHADELCLSVHGDTARVHDALTGRAGSFAKMKAALAAAAAYAGTLKLTVNAVAMRLNVARLPRIAALAAAHPKAREFWISSLIPEGAALAGYSELAVPYARIMAQAEAVAAQTERRGVGLFFFGFPLCALGRFRPSASERHKNPSGAVSLQPRPGGRAVLGDAGPDAPPRVKPARCRSCRLDGECAGVWERHLREFGDEEVRPCKR
jgi:MoaA/NifB/PqqE/SkfB family radical SAM enzyme